MKRTFKLFVALISLLILVCAAVACDFLGERCDHEFIEIDRVERCNMHGTVKLKCSKCGYRSHEKIPPSGHDIEIIEAIAPTCIEAGKTSGEVCKRCGEIVVYPEEIAPCHTVVIQEEIPATCTENGMSEGQYCSACNTVIVEQTVIYAAHSYDTMKEIEPTCTEDGQTGGVACTICGLVSKEPENIPAGHLIEYFSECPASCHADGYTAGYKCTRCDYIQSGIEVIPAAHKSVIMTDMEGYPATCTSYGMTSQMICTECHAITVKRETIPMLDHTLEVISGYPATCMSNGLTDGYRCTSCKGIIKSQEVIPIKQHTPTKISGYTATCTSAGFSDGEICSDCGMIIKNQYHISAFGHDFVDKKCTRCDYKVTAELVYEELTSPYSLLRTNVQYVVAGLSPDAAPEVVVIPDTHNGCPVVGIKDRAFENATSINKIVIPPTIHAIGNNAFSGCTALETIECADFAQIASWGDSWKNDTPNIKVKAISNQGKTPYDVYLDAMNSVQHNYKEYSTVSKYYSYWGNDLIYSNISIQQLDKDNNFLQVSTITDHEYNLSETSIKGYVDGYLYRQANGTLQKQKWSYEAFLHGVSMSSTTVKMQPNDFKRVEFYQDISGNMHLTLVLDSTRMTEILKQMYPQDNFDDFYLIDPSYEYEFYPDGYIKSYSFKATSIGYMSIMGSVSFSSHDEKVNISTSYLNNATDVTIPACGNNHYLVEYVKQVEPSCYAEGRSAYSYCRYCGVAITNMTPIAPSHNFENGECTACGIYEDENTSTGLAYILNSDQTGYIIVGIGECEDTDIYVPAQICGITVSEILADAFNGTQVENVIINGDTIAISEFIGWKKE